MCHGQRFEFDHVAPQLVTFQLEVYHDCPRILHRHSYLARLKLKHFQKFGIPVP